MEKHVGLQVTSKQRASRQYGVIRRGRGKHQNVPVIPPSLVMVGAFPPPVVGLATTNAAVRDQLIAMGLEPEVINIAASSLERSVLARVRRLRRVVGGLYRLIRVRRQRGSTLYISISGGLGQAYEIAFIGFARCQGMRVVLRHCSFSYLDKPNFLAKMLTMVAGPSAMHITQSKGMAERLTTIYGTGHVVPISNAVLYPQAQIVPCPRQELRTLGLLSNLSAEKGVFEFLELATALEAENLPIKGKLAGPFQDARTERAVRERLEKLSSVEYVGPVYGADKDRFFSEIDVLIFPTRYKNETEAKVNHEAMSRGIPVIAYGRGCIPEIIGEDSGRVISPEEPFLPGALAQIQTWLRNPAEFQSTSRVAARRFADSYAQSEKRWKALLNDLLSDTSHAGTAWEREDSSS